jgi:hypothetical protein
MKMKNLVTFKNLSAIVVSGIVVLASCSKSSDNPLSSTDSQNVNSESVSSSTANEASDLGNSVIANVSDTQLTGARVSSGTIIITGLDGKDGRLKGATITIVGSGTKAAPSGTITIDYGTAGVTTGGVTRKGKIIIAYVGSRLQPHSTRTISFDGFSRNAVTITGTYNVTVVDTTLTNTDFTATFSHTTNLTLTFPDNTTITRQASFTVVWDLIIATPLQSTITYKAGGGASGTTRKGASYAMSITKDLIHRADCFASGMFLPISGTKTIAVTSSSGATPVVYTLDFGSGSTCTNSVTVTVNGKTKTITVSGDGN